MRYFYTVVFLFCLVMPSWTVPARQRMLTVRMIDGEMMRVRFCGDEHRSFYLSEDGFVVELADDSDSLYVKTEYRPSDLLANVRLSGIGSVETAPIKPLGSPKIPVILVNFNDLHMSVAETDEACNAFYDLFCNGTRDGQLYTGAGSAGAVRDYFAQQSDSVFLPEFEVFGPVTLCKPMAYYGQNSGNRKDVNFSEFCEEALQLAMEGTAVDWSRFDNDGDGTVDLAFFIYAGTGENVSGADPNTIWPKEMLSPMVINGIEVAVMGCCNELIIESGEKVVDGIGTMCHEIMHALGMPDMYDTNYVGLGMSYWSLMDCGNFCKNGYVPCGLTAYEREFLQWRPIEELDGSSTLTLRPLEAGGCGYKIVNSANPAEYYIIENRQAVGWDVGLCTLGSGMLAVHVDYDENVWSANRVNAVTDHQRMSIIPANNLYVGQYNAQSVEELLNALNGQPYPGNTGNTALTDYSIPAATVFSGGFMGKPITQIRETPDGNIVCKFMARGVLDIPDSTTATVERITADGFVLRWDTVEHAEAYRVMVYDVSEERESVLLETIDSVFTNRFSIEGLPSGINKMVCKVCAVSDEYEDSQWMNYEIVFPADGIEEPFEQETTIQVYNLSGQRIAEGKKNDIRYLLQKGIYIFRHGTMSEKVVIR